jgi:hypothetical protein
MIANFRQSYRVKVLHKEREFIIWRTELIYYLNEVLKETGLELIDSEEIDSNNIFIEKTGMSLN